MKSIYRILGVLIMALMTVGTSNAQYNYYQVRYKDGTLTSKKLSDYVSHLSIADYLESPDSLKAKVDNAKHIITLTWEPVSGATSYNVIRRNVTKDESQSLGHVTATEFVDEDCPTATVYYSVYAEADGCKAFPADTHSFNFYNRNSDDYEECMHAVFDKSVIGKMKAYMSYGAYSHSNYGWASLMLALDSRGQDLVGLNIGYNWYRYQCLWEDNKSGAWLSWYATCYPEDMIMAANSLLTDIDGVEDIYNNATDRYIIAQCLAIRAYAMFTQVQLLCGRATDRSARGIAIITPEQQDAYKQGEKIQPSTIGETYDAIMTDLDRAIGYMKESNVTTCGTELSLAALYGIRARVNLVCENWATAKDDATKAMEVATERRIAHRDEVILPSFASIDECNWLWGIDMKETDRIVTSGLVNWPSHMCTFSGYSYCESGAWRQIDSRLYKLITDTDVRKGWWLNANGAGVNFSSTDSLGANYIEYIQRCAIPPYTVTKFAPYQGIIGNDVKAQDVPLMRVEEMLLIRAEAAARLGDFAGARVCLGQLMAERDSQYTPSTDDGALIDEILLQRRIELWGEGISWYDLRRLGKGIDRTGESNWAPNLRFKISGDDPRMRIRVASEVADKWGLDSISNPDLDAPVSEGL